LAADEGCQRFQCQGFVGCGTFVACSVAAGAPEEAVGSTMPTEG
jgi:hypothetical protein